MGVICRWGANSDSPHRRAYIKFCRRELPLRGFKRSYRLSACRGRPHIRGSIRALSSGCADRACSRLPATS